MIITMVCRSNSLHFFIVEMFLVLAIGGGSFGRLKVSLSSSVNVNK